MDMAARAVALALTLCATLGGCGLVLDLDASDAGVGGARDGAAGDAMAVRLDADRRADGRAALDAPIARDTSAHPDGTTPPGDSASDAIAAPSDAMSTCGVLYDDFTDPTVDPLWEVFFDDGTTIRETGGVLAIDPVASVTDPRYAGYYTGTPMNLTGGWVEVRAARLTNATSYSEMFLEISDGAWLVLFGYSYGRMVCRIERTDHSMRDMSLPPYDGSRDVYWRIRHDGSSLICETSSDRATWTERARKPSYLDMTNVRFSPYAGTWRDESAPGVAHYDDVRAFGPALCP